MGCAQGNHQFGVKFRLLEDVGVCRGLCIDVTRNKPKILAVGRWIICVLTLFFLHSVGSPRPRLWSRGLRFGGQTKAALCAAAEECSEKSALAPQTAPYLIESAGRPVHLFRLPPALARPDPDSPAQLQQTQAPDVTGADLKDPEEDSAAACPLFALESCVSGCEENVADAVITPLRLTDPTQRPPCVGYKQTSPPHDLTCSKSIPPPPPVHK